MGRQARLALVKIPRRVEVLMSVAVRPAPGPQLCAGHAAASTGSGEHFFDLCGVFDGQLAAFLLLEGLLEGLRELRA
jgi:hypothetical protein